MDSQKLALRLALLGLNHLNQKSRIMMVLIWKQICHWTTPIFNRKYIFKWWIFHCHASFWGLEIHLQFWYLVDSHQHLSDFPAYFNDADSVIDSSVAITGSNKPKEKGHAMPWYLGGGFKHDFLRWYNLQFKRDSWHSIMLGVVFLRSGRLKRLVIFWKGPVLPSSIHGKHIMRMIWLLAA